MADELLFANRFMDRNGHAGARDRMIVLLADGQKDCGGVRQAMATLQASGIVFHHETVSFGTTPASPANADLREIATRTGGTYHHAANATQLADVFMEFANTLSVIGLPGRLGVRAEVVRPRPPCGRGQPGAARGRGPVGLLGGFAARNNDTPPPSPTPHGPPVTSNTTSRWRHRRRRAPASSRTRRGTSASARTPGRTTTRVWRQCANAAAKAAAAPAPSMSAALRSAAAAWGSRRQAFRHDAPPTFAAMAEAATDSSDERVALRRGMEEVATSRRLARLARLRVTSGTTRFHTTRGLCGPRPKTAQGVSVRATRNPTM